MCLTNSFSKTSFNNASLHLVVLLGLILVSLPARSYSGEPERKIEPTIVDGSYGPQVGQIRIFTGNFVPFSGTWAECNGQLLNKNSFGNLYSIIGTRFGGDGNPNFALPKMDPVATNTRYIICIAGMLPTHSTSQPPPPPGPTKPPLPPPQYPPNNPFVGQLKIYTGNFVPFSDSWAECNGQLLQISKYPLLFSMIKNRYGGDGRTTFALPNIPPAIANERYIINLAGNNPETR